MDSPACTDEKRKPRKRVVTEARRNQNRVAQMIHRQKQREKRLQNRLQVERPGLAGRELRPKHPNGTESSRSRTSYAASRRDQAVEPQLAQEQSTPAHEWWDQDDALRAGSFFLPGPFAPTPSGHDHRFGNPGQTAPNISCPSFFSNVNHSVPDIFPGADLLSTLEPHGVGEFEPGLGSSIAMRTPNDLSGIQQVDGLHMSARNLGESEIFLDRGTQQFDIRRSSRITPLSTRPCFEGPTAARDNSEIWSAVIPPAAKNMSLEDVLVAGVQVLLFNGSSPTSIQDPAPTTTASSTLPSPYVNALQLSRTRTISACLRNALRIGLAQSDIVKPFCIGGSLFYRPNSPSDDAVALLASASKPHIPIHLQPTLPQVLYQHPAFLDLIPMPEFRTKVILAGARRGWGAMGSEERFDLFELKKDIFQDGLAWGGKDGCGMQVAQGQPWDMKSWGAADWFVKKWRALLDDVI